MKPKLQAAPPINVALPNTTELKMQAMLALARGMESLARQLGSTNVTVSISNNVINSDGSAAGINISTPESA